MKGVAGICVDCSTWPSTATGSANWAWAATWVETKSGPTQTSSFMKITRSPLAARSAWLRFTAGSRSSLLSSRTITALSRPISVTIAGVSSLELSATRISSWPAG